MVKALGRVREGGAETAGDIEVYEFGRFGWLPNPAGNKMERWEPYTE